MPTNRVRDAYYTYITSISNTRARHLNDLKVAGVDENEPIFVSKRIVRNVIFTLSTLYIDASNFAYFWPLNGLGSATRNMKGLLS